MKWDYEGKQLEYSDRFRGHSIFISSDNADYQGSLAFGKLLGARLKRAACNTRRITRKRSWATSGGSLWMPKPVFTATIN